MKMQDDEISRLSNAELAELLRSININVPITSSTRKICENRYRSHIFSKLQNGSDNNDNRLTNGVVSHTLNGVEVNEKSQKDITRLDNSLDIDKNNAKDDNSISTSKTTSSQSEHNNTEIDTSAVENTNEISTEKNLNNGINHEDNQTPSNCLDTIEKSSNQLYYGVWLPQNLNSLTLKEPIQPTVFTSQKDALITVKNHRGSRFKSFSSKEDAESFSTCNIHNLSIEKICSMVSPSPPPVVNSNVNKFIAKAPTFQDLMKFRKAIDDNNVEFVQNVLAVNPKYLISAGDMTVVLQEGSRLNAVHVAVKSNKLEILTVILDTLQNFSFLQRMYPDADEENLNFRRKHLVDLYLNTPEKILCDTPLHMASKFGFPDIVRKLIDFEQVKLNSVNKDGKTCREVVCARSKLRGEELQKVKTKILSILEEKAFIPLYESLECTCKVGEPIIALSPKALKSTDRKVKAFAGPMPVSKAHTVYDRWGKSPRSKRYAQIALTDFDRGMERLGRIISAEEKVPFNEYWSFLECYTNLQTKQGLMKLEKYLYTKAQKLKTIKRNNKRQSLSAPKLAPTKKIEMGVNKDDDVKKKLTFDEDDTTSSENVKSLNKSRDQMTSPENFVTESLCICGELLAACDKCGSVNIDLKNMSVAFNLRSPLKISPDTELSKRMALLKLSDTPLKCSVSSPTLSAAVKESEKPVTKSNSVRDLFDTISEDVYIYGDFPSKIDNDVLLAIGDAVHIITREEFPFVYSWKISIQNYSWAEIKSWPAPGSPRYKQKCLEKSYLWTA